MRGDELTIELINSIYGYNESPGERCPLVWKVYRQNFVPGDPVKPIENTPYWDLKIPLNPVRQGGRDDSWLSKSVHRVVGLMKFPEYGSISNLPNIDHINRNKGNNLASNLRAVTKAQNSRNREKKKGVHSSDYRGVCWSTERNKWVASVKINGKQTHIGAYHIEKDAAIAYDNYLIGRYGIEGVKKELFILNFPEPYGIQYDDDGVMRTLEEWVPPPRPQTEMNFTWEGGNTTRIIGSPKKKIVEPQLTIWRDDVTMRHDDSIHHSTV